MKIPTANLTGAALDWAAAKCEGTLPVSFDDWKQTWPHYSTRWSAGGPIIERQKVSVECQRDTVWAATVWVAQPTPHRASGARFVCASGDAPLTAVMRAYVALKLGDEVDVPDELVKGDT